MPFPRPSVKEQAAIASALRAQVEQQHAEEHCLVKLHQLKSGLMADLLTGRVRVPEAREALAQTTPP